MPNRGRAVTLAGTPLKGPSFKPFSSCTCPYQLRCSDPLTTNAPMPHATLLTATNPLTLGQHASHVEEPPCGQLKGPLVACAQDVKRRGALKHRLAGTVPYIAAQHLSVQMQCKATWREQWRGNSCMWLGRLCPVPRVLNGVEPPKHRLAGAVPYIATQHLRAGTEHSRRTLCECWRCGGSMSLGIACSAVSCSGRCRPAIVKTHQELTQSACHVLLIDNTQFCRECKQDNAQNKLLVSSSL